MFQSFAKAAFAATLAIAACATAQQQDGDANKHFEVKSSVGDLHVGSDGDARKAGLPLYPGAKPHHDKDDSNAVNLGLLTEAFGMKLVVAKYDSDDAPGKVIDFYRDKLKKYGKVLECHTKDHAGAKADFNDSDDDSGKAKPVKCEGDNQGPVTELKVGTENNQHVVEIEPVDGRSGSTFAIVYVHTRGKQGDI
jgi:hypothetical protein